MPKSDDIKIPTRPLRTLFNTAKAMGRYEAFRELYLKEKLFTDQQRNLIYGLAMESKSKLESFGIKFQEASEGELPAGDKFDPSLGNASKPD
jgi:hypothetical protein